jgi:hypothetical protein
MPFNLKLRREIKKWEKRHEAVAVDNVPNEVVRVEREEPISPGEIRPFPVDRVARERVVGGDILWIPVDRVAKRVVAKASWLCKPPPPEKPKEPEKPKKKKKERTYKMGKNESIRGGGIPTNSTESRMEGVPGLKGIKTHRIAGEEYYYWEDVQTVLCQQIRDLFKELHPAVKDAEEARATVNKLMNGIDTEMSNFRSATKTYLDDIRHTKFAVVGEANTISKELRDVRQFFLGPDYTEQVERLKEFIQLCERLKALKDSGFLDAIADTLIKLA